MADLGLSLREAREARGLSIDDVARGTHIRPSFLQALEEERFGDLPHPVYTRGFLRNYATFAGIDAEEVLAQYEHLIEQTAPKPVQKAAPEIAVPIWRGPNPRLLAVAIALIAFFAFLIFLFKQYSDFSATSSNTVVAVSPTPASTLPPLAVAPIPTVTPIPTKVPSPTAVPPTQVPTRAPEPSPTPARVQVAETTSSTMLTTSTASTATTTVTADATATATPTGKVQVSIEVSKPCWTQVTIDGKLVFTGTLQSGASETWVGQDFITLRVGNAGGIRVVFNGTDEGTLGKSGEVLTKTYK